MIMHLHGHGRLTWEHAAALLHDTQCAWIDLDGANYGPPPETTPVGASHLWAWNNERCLRVRFDDDAAYVGELRSARTAAGGNGERVQVTIRTGIRLWQLGDMQTGPIPDEMRSGDWELLEITGERPTTFVRQTTQ